jgi:hypothetical protein
MDSGSVISFVVQVVLYQVIIYLWGLYNHIRKISCLFYMRFLLLPIKEKRRSSSNRDNIFTDLI